MQTTKRSRFLAALLALVMVLTLLPMSVFAADVPAAVKVDVAKASDIAAGQYLIAGISALATDDGATYAFMSTKNSTDTRLMSAQYDVQDNSVAAYDANCTWNLIETDGGFYVQNAANEKYLYYGSNSGNNIYQTSDISSAGVWNVVANGDNWTLQETGSNRMLSANRFGGSGSYYLGFASYATTSSTKRALEFYRIGDVPQNHVIESLDELTDGSQVVIFNPANMMALSSVYSGYNNSGVELKEENGKLTGFAETELWTVSVNENGTYSFSTVNGNRLSMDTQYFSMPLDKVNDTWIVTEADGGYYINNVGRNEDNSYRMEWYADNGNWSSYYKNNDGDLFIQQFYLVVESMETPEGTLPADGDEVVIYNASAQGVLGVPNDMNVALECAGAAIVDGVAVPENGAQVFTVGVSGGDYTFKAGDKYLASDDAENLFLTEDESAHIKWNLEEGTDGYVIYSKESIYTFSGGGTAKVCIEYFGGSFSGWSYKAANKEIFEFNFYPVAEGTPVTNGVVNMPEVTVSGGDAYVGTDYTLGFSVNAVFGVAEIKVVLNNGELEVVSDETGYKATVPAAQVNGDSLSFVISGKDNCGVEFNKAVSVKVIDEPVIGNVAPASNSEYVADKRPVISAEIVNAGEKPNVSMTVNKEAVNAVYADGVVSYTPAEDMADGKVSVSVTVSRADGKTSVKTWSFFVGKAQYQLYFGQLHSHTAEYSDGAGTLAAGLDYIKNLPASANVQFVAFTDHSNYFDSTSSVNPEQALYDMSLASAASQEKWANYNSAVAAFNESQSDVVAIAGFEMTWSGGPGHINTFNTPGIVSRKNGTLNNKTNDAGMKAYYALLSQTEGAGSISQLNHPGTTFGNFSDFAYWDAVIDSRVFLVEVGNGEGQIGAGGYYPSYEQYIMALDKGWHVAPTNNQDNHKGKWGNANDARDVILTNDFSEEGIYQAMREMRIYATEDKNLELYYTVNGLQLGSSITEVPEKLNIEVSVSDPDSNDSISKVEVVANSGKVVYTWDNPTVLAAGVLSVSLDPDYSYYFIRVTEGDGDLAVTAPVWVGESLKLGISAFDCGTSTPVTGEELTLTTTVFNSESSAATIKSVVYTTDGSKVIGTYNTAYSIPASGNLEVNFKYTPDVAKVMTITVTVVVEQDGKEYTFTKDITLDVLNADELVYIGIDASHYNEYVAGNYKDSMGNFGELAAGYSVRTNELKTTDDLIAACANEKYKAIILTAPSRRDDSALRNPYECYTDAELEALVAFNNAGGTIVLAGWSDYYESYGEFPAADHMAAQQNKVLAALGSSLRISDDGTYDDTLNGGQAQRLYFNTYNMDNLLVKGVEVDSENPNDRLYTEVFSHYGGASIYVVDADGEPTTSIPTTVSPVVYGHASTYSKNSDGVGFEVPKYAVTEDDNRLMVMATEQLDGKGLIIVSGAAFMSNFEVQATISDNGSEKNYSNYKICENLVEYVNPVNVTPIATVQQQTETGYKYTIEGVVTTNASGYDKNTAFFDCIYVQDATGGVCCFPVAGDYKIGDIVRVTGTTDFYQGEMELQVSSIQKIGEGEAVAPAEVTAAQINDGSVLGQFITLKGTVKSFSLENGLVQTIMVKDAQGNVARVFIDGYICSNADVENLVVGCEITVSGVSSYDDTFNAPEGPFPRIRVNDRSNIVCGDVVADPFTDIAGNGYHDWIVEAAKAGIINGYSDGTYRPGNEVTRAQFVTMLYRAAGSPVVTGDISFADAGYISAVYKDAVVWGVQNGIIAGYGDNTFRPNQNVTRAQMATFLYRYLVNIENYDFGDVAPLTFADKDSIANVYADAVAAIVSAGIMNGFSQTTFGPNATANRGMAATVIYRVYNSLHQ